MIGGVGKTIDRFSESRSSLRLNSSKGSSHLVMQNVPQASSGYKYQPIFCSQYLSRNFLLLASFTFTMDSFTTLSATIKADTTGPSIPQDFENGGGGGSGSYCVVAKTASVDDLADQEKGGSGGSGSYCVIA